MSSNLQRFSNRVDDYVKYRPDYPAELFSFVISEAGLKPGDSLADIGAGTGISTAPFLKQGLKVYAVEPNREMLSALLAIHGDSPSLFTVNGTAENTGLAEHSCSAIFCAQAFHWFDHQQALAEFNRILRPGGMVFLVWNDRNTDDTLFSIEYEAFLKTHATDYLQVDHKAYDSARLRELIPYTISERTFENEQLLDLDGLVGRVASSSYMPSRADERYEAMVTELNSLFYRHNLGSKVRITYTTRVFYFTTDAGKKSAS